MEKSHCFAYSPFIASSSKAFTNSSLRYPDQWERVDAQPHIGLMLVALNIAPHPPEITPAGYAGKLITLGGEYRYVDCDD
jgi:hypothetical protein